MPNKKTVKGSRKVSKKSSKKTSKKVSKKVDTASSDELRELVNLSDEQMMPNHDLNNYQGVQQNMMQPNMMQQNMMQPNMMQQNMMQQNMQNAISPSQIDPMMIQQYVPYQQNHNLGGLNQGLMSPTQMVQGLNNFSSSVPDLTSNAMNLNTPLTPSFSGLNTTSQPVMSPSMQMGAQQPMVPQAMTPVQNLPMNNQPNVQGLLNFANM